MQNLLREGKPRDRIHYVGHVMIDNLLYQCEKLKSMDGAGARFPTWPLKQINKKYAFLTLHRPSNVDSREIFGQIAAALDEIAGERPIFFPVHPRTKKMIEQLDIRLSENVIMLPPLSFTESLFLWKDAEAVLTDSGGLQEETTALGVPCVTIRENTERPITVEIGTNLFRLPFQPLIFMNRYVSVMLCGFIEQIIKIMSDFNLINVLSPITFITQMDGNK
ncbi:MAG: UDP-N-acetylglucosamine 2-epimerase [Pseudomonadota bacterium]